VTIKQHIGTPVIHLFIIIIPEHVLVPHLANGFVLNV
jgi:hypothetical protein